MANSLLLLQMNFVTYTLQRKVFIMMHPTQNVFSSQVKNNVIGQSLLLLGTRKRSLTLRR